MDQLKKTVDLPAELTADVLIRGALALEQGECLETLKLVKKGLEKLIAQKIVSNRVAKEFKQLVAAEKLGQERRMSMEVTEAKIVVFPRDEIISILEEIKLKLQPLFEQQVRFGTQENNIVDYGICIQGYDVYLSSGQHQGPDGAGDPCFNIFYLGPPLISVRPSFNGKDVVFISIYHPNVADVAKAGFAPLSEKYNIEFLVFDKWDPSEEKKYEIRITFLPVLSIKKFRSWLGKKISGK